jgi:hypothetical protein
VSFNTRPPLRFQRGGAPPHHSREVRQGLSESYSGRWVGRRHEATVSWPARSPDFNPFHSVMWGCLKGKIYARTADTREENYVVLNHLQLK